MQEPIWPSRGNPNIPVCSYCPPGVSDRVRSCSTLIFEQAGKVKGLDNQGYVIIVYFMQVMKCRDNEDVEIIRC